VLILLNKSKYSHK